MCGVAADITDRRRAQEEKEALETALQRSQRMESLGQLAGGVAHDFNNLLAVILNYAEFVGEEIGPDHTAAADVAEIVRATQRAADLTRQLLVFSRHDHLRLEAVDVNRVALETQRMLDRTLGEDVELVVVPALEPVHVLADRGQLEQVLMNLVLNARDAMPRGGRVTVTIEPVDRFVRVEVADDGEGMTPETAERAFDPFFTTKPKGRGTGLGLATVYGIVTGSGGHIEIESHLQEGTTITMHLPSAEPDKPAAEAATGPLDESNGMTVVVVEDEDAIRTLTRRILSRQGYEVVEAETPEHALSLCEDMKPDLLLTDVVMPGHVGQGPQRAPARAARRPARPVHVRLHRQRPRPVRAGRRRRLPAAEAVQRPRAADGGAGGSRPPTSPRRRWQPTPGRPPNNRIGRMVVRRDAASAVGRRPPPRRRLPRELTRSWSPGPRVANILRRRDSKVEPLLLRSVEARLVRSVDIRSLDVHNAAAGESAV